MKPEEIEIRGKAYLVYLGLLASLVLGAILALGIARLIFVALFEVVK
jgi:hypothetical protein